MSSFTPRHPPAVTARAAARRRRRRLAVGAGLVSTAAAVALAVALSAGGGSTAATGTDAPAGTHDHAAAPPPGYRLTGEVSPMGGRYIETPGTRSGAAEAGGVVVTDGADIAMGRVPLAFAVNPTWHLRNTGSQPVTLGRPGVAVVRGCCPAEPELGASTLAPGEETILAFPTQMHPGMDGDHLFRLSVPVSGADRPLELSVAGDFR